MISSEESQIRHPNSAAASTNWLQRRSEWCDVGHDEGVVGVPEHRPLIKVTAPQHRAPRLPFLHEWFCERAHHTRSSGRDARRALPGSSHGRKETRSLRSAPATLDPGLSCNPPATHNGSAERAPPLYAWLHRAERRCPDVAAPRSVEFLPLRPVPMPPVHGRCWWVISKLCWPDSLRTACGSATVCPWCRMPAKSQCSLCHTRCLMSLSHHPNFQAPLLSQIWRDLSQTAKGVILDVVPQHVSGRVPCLIAAAARRAGLHGVGDIFRAYLEWLGGHRDAHGVGGVLEFLPSCLATSFALLAAMGPPHARGLAGASTSLAGFAMTPNFSSPHCNFA